MTKKYQLHLTAFSLTLSVGLVSTHGLPAQVQAQIASTNQGVSSNWKISQAFEPPPGGALPTTAGGGTRSLCLRSRKPLTALIPKSGLGQTLEAHPSILVYLPENQAQNAEFLLKDENEKDVYRTTFPVPKTGAGIFSFKLPADKTSPPLVVGKNYRWYLALICQPENRREDLFVGGLLVRVQPSAGLRKALEKVAPQQRPGLYAKFGIWQDALTTLAQLRRAKPDDPAIAANWQALLNSVGLEKMVAEPLLN